MRGDMAPVFKFIIGVDRKVTKDPPIPWNVGRPKEKLVIGVDNRDNDRHEIRMVRFKHTPTGKLKDPLTGTKKWVVGDTPKYTQHKVKDLAEDGEYHFFTQFDGVDLEDPEIVVSPPDRPLGPRRRRPPKRPRAVGRAATKQARKAGGRRTAAKRRGAKKAKTAKRRKPSSTRKTAKRRKTRG